MSKVRQVVPYAVYRHFKGMFYATMGVSHATQDRITGWERICKCKHTETGKVFYSYFVNGEWIHDAYNYTDDLVLYKSLYDDSIPWARPVEMFLQKVPEGCESVNSLYRFEQM